MHFLRETLGLTGTHVGCDTSSCGACVVHHRRRGVKSCTVFAVQADGAQITTIEGIGPDGNFHPVQEGFWEKHGLQCGYCTPGMIMTAVDLLEEQSEPDRRGDPARARRQLCRCTGYQNIVKVDPVRGRQARLIRRERRIRCVETPALARCRDRSVS